MRRESAVSEEFACPIPIGVYVIVTRTDTRMFLRSLENESRHYGEARIYIYRLCKCTICEGSPSIGINQVVVVVAAAAAAAAACILDRIQLFAAAAAVNGRL